MASTNKTTYYDLSQYTANDKPTYLVDYNTDMNNIDAGIHEVDVKAGTSITNIGTMTDLQTTEKGTLVGAINEVKAATVANATNIAGNTTNIGTLSSLETVTKSSLVGAINEIVNKFNFVNFVDIENNNMTFSNIKNNVLLRKRFKIAANSDYSIIKFYGYFSYDSQGYTSTITIENAIPLDYRPASDIVVSDMVALNNNGAGNYALNGSVTFKANGNIVIDIENSDYEVCVNGTLIPCLLFLKDFGDTPVTTT